MTRKRVVFFGCPQFAVPALLSLYEKHHIICAVTRPPQKAGRGLQSRCTPILENANKLNLKVFTPLTIKGDEGDEILDWIMAQNPDIFVVAAYCHFLPRTWRKAAFYGCLNIHPSLLPLYRGASPAQWAIAKGEKETGVTIMKLVAKMDAGPVYDFVKTPIMPCETGGSLLDRLGHIGAELLISVIDRIDTIKPLEQDHDKATFAPLFSRDSGLINWDNNKSDIVNHIRAFNPWPGSYFRHNDKAIKVHWGEVANWGGKKGEISASNGDICPSIDGSTEQTGNNKEEIPASNGDNCPRFDGSIGQTGNNKEEISASNGDICPCFDGSIEQTGNENKKNPINGQVLSISDGLLVKCADGAVKLTQLQAPGKKILDGAQFLRGYRICPGEILS